MTGNGLLFASVGVYVDIVTGTVMMENTPCFSELADEFFPLHTEISSVR